MITQKEIAEKLGISRTTVARAINGSPLIKEETKRKVLELVKETKYEKNYVGSSLAGKRSKKVCALVVESKNEFYTTEIKRGINIAAKEYKVYNSANVKSSAPPESCSIMLLSSPNCPLAKIATSICPFDFSFNCCAKYSAALYSFEDVPATIPIFKSYSAANAAVVITPNKIPNPNPFNPLFIIKTSHIFI